MPRGSDRESEAHDRLALPDGAVTAENAQYRALMWVDIIVGKERSGTTSTFSNGMLIVLSVSGMSNVDHALRDSSEPTDLLSKSELQLVDVLSGALAYPILAQPLNLVLSVSAKKQYVAGSGRPFANYISHRILHGLDWFKEELSVFYSNKFHMIGVPTSRCAVPFTSLYRFRESVELLLSAVLHVVAATASTVVLDFPCGNAHLTHALRHVAQLVIAAESNSFFYKRQVDAQRTEKTSENFVFCMSDDLQAAMRHRDVRRIDVAVLHCQWQSATPQAKFVRYVVDRFLPPRIVLYAEGGEDIKRALSIVNSGSCDNAVSDSDEPRSGPYRLVECTLVDTDPMSHQYGVLAVLQADNRNRKSHGKARPKSGETLL